MEALDPIQRVDVRDVEIGANAPEPGKPERVSGVIRGRTLDLRTFDLEDDLGVDRRLAPFDRSDTGLDQRRELRQLLVGKPRMHPADLEEVPVRSAAREIRATEHAPLSTLAVLRPRHDQIQGLQGRLEFLLVSDPRSGFMTSSPA